MPPLSVPDPVVLGDELPPEVLPPEVVPPDEVPVSVPDSAGLGVAVGLGVVVRMRHGEEPIDDLYVPTGHSSQRSDEQYAVVNTPEIPSVLASSPIIILPAGASYVVGEPQ